MRRTVLPLLFLLFATPLLAQNPADTTQDSVTPYETPRFEPAEKKRVVDWKFITVTALSIGAAVLDVEGSQRALRRCPTCTEASSWLLGPRPSRGRMYATILPLKVAETWAAYKLKKSGKPAWVAVPFAGGGVNLFGGLHGLSIKASPPIAQTCPAGGAGCAGSIPTGN